MDQAADDITSHRDGGNTFEHLVGRVASVDLTVGVDDCAARVGSGDLLVLASPTVLALAERAAVAALAGDLPDGTTTVGTYAELRHSAPTLPGETVSATASVVTASAKSIDYEITVTTDVGTVASVVHRRALIRSAAFLERARSAAARATE